MQTTNLNYAIDRLKQAKRSTFSPAVYVLWGVIVLLAYVVTMVTSISMSSYWFFAIPVGIALSIWLGIRYNNKIGQQSKSYGMASTLHFSIMLVFYAAATLSSDPASGLLIVGVAYCLGAVHLDKFMSIFGICALLCYIGISTEWVQSGYIIGGVLATSLFVTALGSALYRANDMKGRASDD